MQGTMRAMDGTGDTKIIWDTDQQAEVDAARQTFDKLTKKGYKAFSVKKGGDKDEMIDKFDPTLEKIILVPPIRGG